MSRRVERVTSATGTFTTASANISVSAPLPFHLHLVALHMESTTVEVTGLSLGAGTFTRLHRQVGESSSLELWAGYDFAEGETDTTLGVTLSGAVNGSAMTTVFVNGAEHAAPAVTAVGASGSGTSVDPGSVTPTADDETQMVLVAAGKMSGATVPSAYASTPGGNEAFVSTATTSSHDAIWVSRRAPTSLSPHKVVTTITSDTWVAINALVTPTAPTPHADTHVYKGRAKKSLDTVGAV